MKIEYESEKKNSKLILYIKYAIIALLMTVAHIVFLGLISVNGITPDLLLILCVWIALVEGPFPALFAGFLIGLLFDVMTTDVYGTNALAKTVAVFVAGRFYRDGTLDYKIGRVRFLAIVFLSSLVHNLVYFFFYVKFSEISYFDFFMKNGIAISSYTTVFAIFTMLFRITKKGY